MAKTSREHIVGLVRVEDRNVFHLRTGFVGDEEPWDYALNRFSLLGADLPKATIPKSALYNLLVGSTNLKPQPSQMKMLERVNFDLADQVTPHTAQVFEIAVPDIELQPWVDGGLALANNGLTRHLFETRRFSPISGAIVEQLIERNVI